MAGRDCICLAESIPPVAGELLTFYGVVQQGACGPISRDLVDRGAQLDALVQRLRHSAFGEAVGELIMKNPATPDSARRTVSAALRRHFEATLAIDGAPSIDGALAMASDAFLLEGVLAAGARCALAQVARDLSERDLGLRDLGALVAAAHRRALAEVQLGQRAGQFAAVHGPDTLRRFREMLHAARAQHLLGSLRGPLSVPAATVGLLFDIAGET